MLTVRSSTASDIPAITEIYAHYVRTGTASFEIDPPDAAEMMRRQSDVLSRGFPYFTAEIDGAIVGYAYAGPYRTRPAYRFTVADSIYVHPGHIGNGIGSILLPELIAGCERAGVKQIVAIIGDVNNAASVRLHARFGFVHAGVLQGVGFKFGRWLDTILMQRGITSS